MDASGAADESAILRTAKSCGPDASMVGVKFAEESPRMTVTTKPDHRGEYEISRNTIACGNAGCPGATVVTNACAYYTSRTRLRVQRAPGIPHALCWAKDMHNSGASCRENAAAHPIVIVRLDVQSGDIAYTCSETSLTLLPAVKSIVAICRLPKKIP
jgi:hypothetical protein